MLSVIIVNWNAGDQLLASVTTAIQYGDSLISKIIVVDNGSTDGSENLIKEIPGVKLILAGENLGFAKACNLGAQHAEGSYLLFLNPDAALYKDSLTKALTFMEHPENAKVGICGIQLVDDEGHVARSCTRFPTVGGFVAHAIGLSRFIPALGYFMSEWDHAETREVDHVIGAFYLVRRCVFDALTGFDERFFVYLEDLDFSLRARQQGWTSVYLADVRAYHAGGGTSNQIKARRLFYSLRSRLQYAFKHFNLIGACVVLATTLFIEPVSRSLLALLRVSWPSFKETWVAYSMLISWLPELFQPYEK